MTQMATKDGTFNTYGGLLAEGTDGSGNPYFLSPVSDHTMSTFDEYAANPRFVELQEELRNLLFNGASSQAPTRAQSPEAVVETSSVRPLPGYKLLVKSLDTSQDGVSMAEKIQYLKIWITECAPWLDMFDAERHFGLRVPILAQTSPPILFAMLALSARQMERKLGKKGVQNSLHLYQESIRSLTEILDVRDPNVVVTACILCCLEMMSVSPRDWRRHVEGCAALFDTFNVHGFSGGLFQAVFWCYARMDLCGAIISDGTESTVLPIRKWAILPPTRTRATTNADQSWAIHDEFIAQGLRVPDMYANYAVYLCANVCDLIGARTRCVELGEDNGHDGSQYITKWRAIWDQLQSWWERRPPEMLPVTTVTTTDDHHLFPAILFAHWAAISANQLYHTASIMMIDVKPPMIVSSSTESRNSALWHARRVVGISMTNPHRGCLNNAIQPLYVAGRLFSHRSEHEAIAGLIKEIEATTGWGACWRIKDLEAAWGYDRGTLN